MIGSCVYIDKEDRQSCNTDKKEPGIVLHFTGLQTFYACGDPGRRRRKGIHQAVHDMSVDPCRGSADQMKYDLFSDEKVDLIDIELVPGEAIQSAQGRRGASGPVAFLFIQPGGDADAKECDRHRRDRKNRAGMRRLRLTERSRKRGMGTNPAKAAPMVNSARGIDCTSGMG